ncbi:hypothetical protein IMCC3317_25520 [Kordia antarctica]|uniref:Uncharacterized protein n=1 Tax=Kordia antarctica TaxID=1218801 RepID=A0A7L4ZMN7_9FLAO|nr:hypothetical protein IMCC3317_25520 [Kordia antarctica]
MNASIFHLNLRIIYFREKIIKNIFIMKKQKLNSIPLKINKTNIANLHYVKGGAEDLSAESNCCSKPNICHTITTRPDSLQM